ncbi:MAG TPA: HDOD domain-containing protein [Bacteroidota bacterium]|nr:HDOD domain-containing protein [Bacteroidota bacterium]
MQQIDSILAKVKEFPTLSSFYSSLAGVINNPNANINDVAEIIEKDQASVTKLLKIANSSIYGFRSRISSVSQAILFIGFEEVKNILLTLKIINLFRTYDSEIKFVNPVDFWKHSIGTGVIARIIGMNIGIQNNDILFLCGITHNIGKLLFYITIPDDYEKVLKLHKNKRISIQDAEREVLGISNSMAGEMLAQKWKLSIPIIEGIKYYQTGYIGEKINLNVAIVHIADIAALLLGFGNDGREFISQPNPKVWELLKLPDNFFSLNYERVKRDFEENSSILLEN